MEKDNEFIQGILNKIGEFGDGKLEFETKDIERLCNIALNKTNMAKFILKEVSIDDRHIEPIIIGEMPKLPIWEDMTITLNFTSSGNTKEFSNSEIVKQIFKKIGELNDR